MKSLTINRQTIRNNLQDLRKKVDGSICADLSGDAFGMGLVETARLLREDGVRTFAVSEAKEAARLRAAGFTEERIIMLSSFTDKAELEALMDLNVVFSVSTSEAGVVLNGLADARSTVVEVQIRLDTGIGRGFQMGDLDKVFSVYRYMSNLAVTGISMDFGEEEKSVKSIHDKYDVFEQIIDSISAAGFETGETMLIDSFGWAAGKIETPDTFVFGAALAGCGELAKVAEITASIEEISWMPKGSRIGGKALSKPKKVAVIAVGSQHGLYVEKRRGLIGKLLPAKPAYVKIGGAKAKIIGKPSLFSAAVDVTKLSCGVSDTAQIEVDTLAARGLDRSYR